MQRYTHAVAVGGGGAVGGGLESGTAVISSGGSTDKAVSLAELLERRSHGLTEPETWALLCQAVQALQDLFLSDGGGAGGCVPLVTPMTLLVTSRGRVELPTLRHVTATPVQAAYLAPEYRSGKSYSDTESEKMWIYSLGETLTRTALTNREAAERLSPALCRALTAMTRRNVSERANLMCLLDVISDYCKSRVQTKPFSHIVMDLHRDSSMSFSSLWSPSFSLINESNSSTWRTLQRQPLKGNNFDLCSNPTFQFIPPGKPTQQEFKRENRIESHLRGAHRPRSYTYTENYHLPTYDEIVKSGKINPKYSYLTKMDYGQSTDSPRSHYRSPIDYTGASSSQQYRPSKTNNNRYIDQNAYDKNKFVQRRQLERHEPESEFQARRDMRKLQNIHSESYGCVRDDGKSENEARRNKARSRRNPVQRAASRLYKAGDVVPRASHNRGCIGPEFVVRSSLPSKQLAIGECKPTLRKTITVILLNGQKLDVKCDPSSTTAGKLFETVIQSQNLQENFMLGLSVLMSGDFIFLPSDTKISKIVQNNQSCSNTILFLRVQLFLPSLRGLRGFEARHILYLQLRRSILEQQLPCALRNIVTLAGLALQAEFGNFREKEHGATEYFLLEHYIPEVMLNESSLHQIRSSLTNAHKERRGMLRDKAEEEFIQHAQSLHHYGSHFYSAVWVTKDSQEDVWLSVTAKGISLYSRKSGPPADDVAPCQDFAWRSIQTLCYSKQFLCILPHSVGKTSKPAKCKLKMDHKKSYFTFRLASLHHQFFLRLRTEYSSLQSLAHKFGVPLKEMKNETNALCKMNSLPETKDTQFKISLRTSSMSSHESSGTKNLKCKRSKSATEIRLGGNNDMRLEEYQNKENENPQKHFGSLSRDVRNGLVLESSFLSGVPNLPSLGRERRNGVLMGTRAIGSASYFSNELPHFSQSDDLEQLSLQSISLCCSSDDHPSSIPYVLNSSLKSADEKFLPDLHETVSDTLLEKFEKLSFVEEERILRSVTVHRNESGSIGLQVTEGSDGNVYVQHVIPNGPVDRTRSIFKGDQIVAVNQQTILNMKYPDALNVLKNTGNCVEFVVSQPISNNRKSHKKKHRTPGKYKSIHKSHLDLNRPHADIDQKYPLFQSCLDISKLAEDREKINNESRFFSCSSLFDSNDELSRTIDPSRINFFEFSRTFTDNNNSVDENDADANTQFKNTSRNNFDSNKSMFMNNIDSKYSKPQHKYRHHPSTSMQSLNVKPVVENTYLKHIRYESAAEIDGIYSSPSNRSAMNKMGNSNVSKSCGTLNDPKLYVFDEFNFDDEIPTSREFSSSCLNIEKDAIESHTKRSEMNGVVIVDMIPKIPQKFEDFLYKTAKAEKVNVDAVPRLNDLNTSGRRRTKSLKDLSRDSETCFNFDDSDQNTVIQKKVALPRSIGLGRRWLGPVRYPVTPGKDQEVSRPMKTFEANTNTYITTSDEEQVFI